MIFRKFKCKGCGKYFKAPIEKHTCDDCTIALRIFAENLVLKPEDIVKTTKSFTKYGIKSIVYKKSKPKEFRNSYS
jgi:hypothetical protein